MSHSSYQQLESRFRHIGALDGASSMLHWDTEVMMPTGAADIRGEQLAALATLRHEKMTDSQIADLLEKAESEISSLSDWQQANLREMRHRYAHANAMPADLVEALTKATTQCEHIWRDTRAKNDWDTFSPAFKEVLTLVREEAATKADALDLSPYDALLDSYDPGMRSGYIDPIFAKLKTFLPDLVQQVIDHQASQDRTAIAASIPIDKQEALGRHLMNELGFDFSHGRIDVSAHPFCGGVPGDVRLTTRYSEDNFLESLFGVLHETGHALYEMGLPEKWHMQPVGQARGMSLHESQSLLVEMQLCRGREFITYLLPHMQTHYGEVANNWTTEQVLHSVDQVERSFIRVNADEVTYPLHVMLRYELEQALLDGSLDVDDLPGAWNEKMKDYLSITPDVIGNGCMQDVHWPGGAIGYFPTYTLGAMIAAQIFDSARQALTDLPEQIQSGNFTLLFEWLREHVHAKASYHSTQDLIKEVTGQALNPAIYKAHLEQRYLSN